MSKVIQLRLRKRWFDAIKKGDKTIEGRIDRTYFSTIDIGDIIKFICEDGESLDVKVINIHRASNFKELYSKFEEKLLPKYCLTEEELKCPWIVYDNILDYANAISEGYKALGIEIVNHID